MRKPPQDVLDRIAGKSLPEIQGQVVRLSTDAFIEIREKTGVDLYDDEKADELVISVECLCWASHLIGAEEGKAERDELRAEVARLAEGALANLRLARDAERERDDLRAQLASLRQCSTCCGTPHASGLPCICGGTNRAEDEVKNLRLESMILRDAVTRMGEELKHEHDPEFQGALIAWREISKKQRDWFCGADVKSDIDPTTAKAALRLLRAAAR